VSNAGRPAAEGTRASADRTGPPRTGAAADRPVPPGAGAPPASDAASHFTTEALGEPAGTGRYVNVDALDPVEFVPGLGFRPVLGERAMANFVSFAPATTAPRHVHEEEQIVIVVDGEFTFDLDGDVRTMRRGDVAVVPSWVPHGARTTDSHCLEIDVFCPPRQSLLKLAEAHAATPGASEQAARDEAAAGQAAGEQASGA
jgi:quercetin dioxygenase-like cupin family protein